MIKYVAKRAANQVWRGKPGPESCVALSNGRGEGKNARDRSGPENEDGMYRGFFCLLSHIALYNPHNDPMTTIVTVSLCSIVPKKSETKVKLLAEGPELGKRRCWDWKAGPV